ncbi:PQQ-binding-like beta-propeller repeat protein [Herbidospora cretacea]|uniref:PQQ-binding-like beta-propeller repeat protein n=1 Tax=Herbidospora cretacea TaxID=28444 RepID=UPI0007745861|nr:PQQ-binding-like beta-propeller repeat protein [Herbidospora cretacea]
MIVYGDRPFAEIGEPALAVTDERRGLLAVAGAADFRSPVPVGVYDTRDLSCRALVHSRHKVHAMAFHPTLPLLAIGTGQYDGGYHFGGELFLLSLETGVAAPLIEHLPGYDASGRQILGLEWLDDQALRVVMAPPDDWDDPDAWTEGHVAVVRRTDWGRVPPRSVTSYDLVGPRIPAPRPDGREAARAAVTRLGKGWEPRRNVHAVEAPLWIFRTDRPATALDAGDDAVYVAYDDGEIVVLDLHTGTVRGRGPLTIGAVSVLPTALTVAGPGRLLVGTGDGRILDCPAGPGGLGAGPRI